MKKLLFILLFIIGIVNFRDHPLIKPHKKKVLELISIQAKNTVGVIDSPKVFDSLRTLETIISSYEYTYVINKIRSIEEANSFYQAQCHNLELSHVILTRYSMKKTCDILKKYLN